MQATTDMKQWHGIPHGQYTDRELGPALPVLVLTEPLPTFSGVSAKTTSCPVPSSHSASLTMASVGVLNLCDLGALCEQVVEH